MMDQILLIELIRELAKLTRELQRTNDIMAIALAQQEEKDE